MSVMVTGQMRCAGFFRFGGTVLLAVLLGGCGRSGEQPPNLVSVTGKVTLNGEPLAGASISFVPRDQTKGTGGFGATLPDGSYEILHRSSKKGIEPGAYTVLFSKFAMPDGSPIPAGQNATDVGATESLPAELTNPPAERAVHVVTVRDGEPNSFDFDLQARKKSR